MGISSTCVEFSIFISVTVMPVLPTLYSVTLMNLYGVLPNHVFSITNFSENWFTLVVNSVVVIDLDIEKVPLDHMTTAEPRTTVVTRSIIPVTIELIALRLGKFLILEFLAI